MTALGGLETKNLIALRKGEVTSMRAYRPRNRRTATVLNAEVVVLSQPLYCNPPKGIKRPEVACA